VFSPFAGIGSEGYQALRLFRKFVGIELKESYWRVACDNMRRGVEDRRERQVTMFAESRAPA
jgi:adenine specific DNA methylase Mod